MGRAFNVILQWLLQAARWMIAPLCLGLAAALVIVLAQFFVELAHAVAAFSQMGDAAVIIVVLKLVDLALVANLVLMLITAGVGMLMRLATTAEPLPVLGQPHEFGAIKLRLFSAITAIAAIDLLETFINLDPTKHTNALWEVVILLAFAASGLLIALMDRIGADHN